MAKIFNSDQLNVKYVSTPGLGGGNKAGGILTFSGEDVSDTALLIDQCQLGFARSVFRKYFLNTTGMAYIIGIGHGNLTVGGLLGKASDFATIFGVDLDNPCSNVNTAVLNVSGMQECGNNNEILPRPDNGKITMSGVIPVSIGITTTVAQDGVLYYNANATFEFNGLSFD